MRRRTIFSPRKLKQAILAKRTDWRHQRVLANLVKTLAPVAQMECPAIVILMPGAVHIGELALRQLRSHPTVVCITNGLASMELEIVANYEVAAVVKVEKTLQHHTIINSLLGSLNRPFWLIDHDCYVLDAGVLDPGRYDVTGRVGMAFYCMDDQVTGFLTPNTFIMLLNPKVIREVHKKFEITSQPYRWDELTTAARARLEELGCHQNRLAESCKSYFDTLRVTALLAEADGCGFELGHGGYSATCRRHPDMIHIGGTSTPTWLMEPVVPCYYVALGAFFWQMCLDHHPSASIREAYKKTPPPFQPRPPCVRNCWIVVVR